MTNAYPLCFSCRCPMDPVSGARKSEAPQEGRAGEKLCSTCVERIEQEEKEREIWPKG